MNPVLEAIHFRRSVRAYEPKPVPKEIVETLIQAAVEAPSGMNTQPWRFVVVENPEFRKRLIRVAVPNSKKYLEPVRETNPQRFELIMKRYDELEDPVYYSAPIIIFVIGTGAAYASESCPMACLNLMLSAHSLGLATCWVKLGSLVTDDPEIVQGLELKDGEAIFGPLLLGYTSEPARPPARRAPVVKWI
jgi:nitroreductase